MINVKMMRNAEKYGGKVVNETTHTTPREVIKAITYFLDKKGYDSYSALARKVGVPQSNISTYLYNKKDKLGLLVHYLKKIASVEEVEALEKDIQTMFPEYKPYVETKAMSAKNKVEKPDNLPQTELLKFAQEWQEYLFELEENQKTLDFYEDMIRKDPALKRSKGYIESMDKRVELNRNKPKDEMEIILPYTHGKLRFDIEHTNGSKNVFVANLNLGKPEQILTYASDKHNVVKALFSTGFEHLDEEEVLVVLEQLGFITIRGGLV